MSSTSTVVLPDIINSCRICFDTKYVEGISLVNNNEILNYFELCIGNVVDFQDSPTYLCKNCAQEVESYAKFKKKCVESEFFWKSYKFVDTKIEIQNDDESSTSIKIENSEENIDINPAPPVEDDFENIDSHFTNDDSDDKNNILENDIKKATKKHSDSIKTYSCTKCNKIYKRFKRLQNHVCLKDKKCKPNNLILINKAKYKHDCGLCDLSFNDNEIKQHLNDHWKNNDLLCKLCDYTGRDFADMVSHRRKHNPMFSGSCFVCSKRSNTTKNLQFHFRSAHLNKPGGLCLYCNKTFQRNKTWLKHERLHTETNFFVCDLCGKKFIYRHQIESHLADHSDVRQFICETCGNGFKRLSTLRGHIKNVHEPCIPVTCKHCNRKFKNQEKLDLHLKKLGEYKPYECSVCSKRYDLECNLKYHMFWHTGERPHVCDICGSKYKAKGQLKLHKMNHTGFKPHKCDACGKCFGTGKELKRHQSVHTGVREHKCSYCTRSFHGLKAMLEHSLQHKVVETEPKEES